MVWLLRLTSFCSSPPSPLVEIELFSVNHHDTVCRYCGSWRMVRDWSCTSTRSLHPGMGSSVGRYSLCSATLWELTKTAVITRGCVTPLAQYWLRLLWLPGGCYSHGSVLTKTAVITRGCHSHGSVLTETAVITRGCHSHGSIVTAVIMHLDPVY